KEGDRLTPASVVGTIETTGVALEQQQVAAQRSAASARLDEVAQQIDAMQVQREIARRTYERTRRLVEQRAATAQQLDVAEGEYRVLNEKIQGAQAQANTIRRDVEAADARVAQVGDRLSKNQIVNPVGGTVLVVYARAGELTHPGAPLYRIANLETMEVRAYITETQLSAVKVGQQATVSFDAGEQRQSVNGIVTWVSPDAEFTPTPIQTRDERADLVYAVKVRVPNPNGVLKIGMPAEVDFTART
ncbi:MAG TPA: HlyD family efflux transporter periplasmic adaptor subunit, partial [Thermoanaerobaculia bacterium]|nr:HlyD family efflux transporter periplasmic adaptor subunit [Thermoanaerobaculia bacterium]